MPRRLLSIVVLGLSPAEVIGLTSDAEGVFHANHTGLRAETSAILRLHIEIAVSPKLMCKFVSFTDRIYHEHACFSVDSVIFYK
jgi:hypothetical protein